MPLLHCVITADLSLGRVDKSSLPQETLMELLLSTINSEGREIISGSEENPKPLSDWHGIRMSPTDEVTEIVWTSLALEGSLEFQWIPDTVITFHVYGDRFYGTVDWPALQESNVQRLNIGDNRLVGTFAVELLPNSIRFVAVSKNKFDGSLQLPQLPRNMTELFAYENNLHGTLQLTNLPKTLRTLSIASNKFSGSIVFKNLPQGMKGIFLSNNALSGDIDLCELPSSIERVNLSKNKFDGSISMKGMPNFTPKIWVGENQELTGSLCLSADESRQIKTEGTKVEVLIQ
mmetsp:Transcript_20869/g.32553  ORF Transcript_20869/g.32553 Transcript_20869/m.32553 type:complete len:290 (-) Transcript_20869:73-942(-)